MKTLMCFLAVFAMAVFTSTTFAQDPAPAPQEPTITSVEVKFDTTTHKIVGVKPLAGDAAGHYLDVKKYHTLRILLIGLLNPSRVHQVNVPYLVAEA